MTSIHRRPALGLACCLAALSGPSTLTATATALSEQAITAQADTLLRTMSLREKIG